MFVMRVHELAKELDLSSKDVLAKLHDLGVEAKSHMSNLDDAAVALLCEKQGKGSAKPAAKDASSKRAAESPAPEKKKVAEKKPEAPKPVSKEKVAAPEPDAAVTSSKEGNVITIRGAIGVKDLAGELGLRPNQLIAELMSMNIFAAINQTLDIKVAREVAEKHGFELEHEKKIDEHRLAQQQQRIAAAEEPEEEKDRPEDLLPRAPVVTFLGHVDHGKTSLLDKIRNTHVAAGESGGITQHIGAYTVDAGGSQITFLDTPGHAAFTAMRARGAKLTDIAVIIIAADDGIMPQTKEAISHAQAAEVALMVAINKIDTPGANVANVMQQLQAEGLAPEEWGGEMICCSVSAITGEGIDHLLEMILLQSEVLELKENPDKRARGYVVESQLEAGMGPTANLLVKAGTLKIGDALLCNRFHGKVKALINDHGVKVKSAGPSIPVKCLGLSGVPEAGMAFRVCSSEKIARATAQETEQNNKDQTVVSQKKASLDDIFQELKDNEKQELKVILKADTQGSVEAIVHSLEEIQSDKVSLNIILTGTSNITENDIMLASASNAVILGFHTAKEPGVDSAAKHHGVEVRLHRVIYELIDEVREGMTGLLAPKIEEHVRGQAEIRQVFVMGKRNKVAGCLVVKGFITPKLHVRVKRNDEILHEGRIASLKHFQDDVAQVKEAQECGIRLEDYLEFAEGDNLEFYELEEVQQTL